MRAKLEDSQLAVVSTPASVERHDDDVHSVHASHGVHPTHHHHHDMHHGTHPHDVVHSHPHGAYDYPAPGSSPHSSSSPYTAQFPGVAYRGPGYDTYGRAASGAALLPAPGSAMLPTPHASHHRHASHPHSVYRPAGWAPYPMDGGVRTPTMTHTSISRPGLSPQTSPDPDAPALVRTSTIPGSVAMHAAGPYGPYAGFQNRAELKLLGKLDDMAYNWAPDEAENRRRIVRFSKEQRGATITARFRPVSVGDRPPNATCVSCIWWQERKECYVTSVDTIALLEALVVAPNKFTVEEKNRIRRNLEGFNPFTVSKSKPESESFFRVIMNFSHPRPRNIEKDVKVFAWKSLALALTKIIGKYSASPMHAAAAAAAAQGLPPPGPAHHHPLLGPVGAATATPQYSLPPLPPPVGGPGYAYGNMDPASPQPLASPRALAAWAPYTTTVPPASTFQTPAAAAAAGLRQPVSPRSEPGLPPASSSGSSGPSSSALVAAPPLRVSTAGLPNIGYVHGLPGLSQSATSTPSTAGSRWGYDFGYPSGGDHAQQLPHPQGHQQQQQQQQPPPPPQYFDTRM
jgi:hypothetical protein